MLDDAMEELVVFDLDGSLAASKSSIHTEMAKLLDFLLSLVKVAVISGGAWLQFEERGARAPCPRRLSKKSVSSAYLRRTVLQISI